MDFHSMIGKLRAIESLGVTKNYVAEEEATNEGSTCAMTAEGESCPVHGLSECPMVPMEEGDIDTLKGMLKNSGQMGEATGGGQAAAMMTANAAKPPTAQDSGETWADWFSRIYGGGQTVATGGDIQGADTSGGVSGNPAGDFTGDPNSTPTSVKPAVEPEPAPATSSTPLPARAAGLATPPVPNKPASGAVAGGDTRMGAASTGVPPLNIVTRGGNKPAPSATPAPAAPQSYDNLSFGKAFAAARKAAGGAGGSFMWKGKPYQTNVKGEQALAWNDPNLKKVGGGWPAAESVDRIMELAGLKDTDDMQDMADTEKVDDMSTDMSIDDLMRKYGVSDDVSEDAPLVGAPFTPLGATNNGPEEWGMVVTGGTNVNHFEESITVNSNMDVRDGRITKSLTISATDEDVDSLAAMLRNAGIGNQISVVKHEEICDGCGRPVSDCQCDGHSDCGCGAPEGECQCGMALENADHDYGNTENSGEGEPLDAEEYIWDGPHLNQRFGKIGDNTLMAERAISLFKNYSKEYSQVLAEADLEPSNAGFDSPLTANSRDEFDKDPFVDETPVDDGSRSPLSTVKRQDVMN